MRILSQDLRHDFPYEKVCIEVTDSGKVFAQGDLWGDDLESNYIQIAEYSTEEKAKKAVEMLRNAYYESEHAKYFRDGTALFSTHFTFPSDEEIEV